jgi:hypothetical protein
LLRLPAVEDNAAMQTEPTRAEPPKRNRRWFQFSRRLLLVGVLIGAQLAILCGFGTYAWWQASIVWDRQRLLRECPVFFFQEAPLDSEQNQRIPVIRRWLGDRAVVLLGLTDSATDDQVKQCRAAFPEVEVNGPMK